MQGGKGTDFFALRYLRDLRDLRNDGLKLRDTSQDLLRCIERTLWPVSMPMIAN